MDWPELLSAATRFRRELHQHPEIAWQEQDTAARIRARLDQAGISWRPCADTGTRVTLNAGASGTHVALRGDIDALPMQEHSQLEWRSQTPGRMHACGHDGHTATLMAVVWWLKAHESSLSHPVSLLFQPAEEGGHGARRMIDEGALDNVDVIFGWHNWPAIPYGQAVCPDGPVMAANGTFDILIHGTGGHASQPDLCRDPVLAAAAVTQSLQQIVSRRLPPQAAAVVSVTRLQADSAATIIPDQASLGGSIRIANNDFSSRVFELIEEVASSTATSYGCRATVTCSPRYPATVNHALPAQRWRNALREELGEHWQSGVPLPIMASEDFSYYLQHIPGAYALIGSGRQGQDNQPCHNPSYDFCDDLIEPAARLFIRLAGGPPPA